MTSTLLRKLAPIAIVCAFFVFQAVPAAACGGLVAPNGAVRLSRATTLVAWHDGIEHYMTSFSYQGDTSKVGWIVPLPAVPLEIQEGGAWTLQRLFRETHPEFVDNILQSTARVVTAAPAQVIEQVQVAALDVTVLRGSGQAVLNWCAANGFVLNGDIRSHLLIYAKGSPIFMAARYDVAAARARGFFQGDGTPLLITMKAAHPWVPLEVLALDGQRVDADIYLLTDEPVNTSEVGAVTGESAVGTDIPGATGFTLAFQEPMNPQLYHDLSTDRNMSWIQPGGWLTYLSLDAPDTAVTYDLGITPAGIIRLAPFGTPPMAVGGGSGSHELAATVPYLPIGTPQVALAVVVVLIIGGGLFLIFRSRPYQMGCLTGTLPHQPERFTNERLRMRH